MERQDQRQPQTLAGLMAAAVTRRWLCLLRHSFTPSRRRCRRCRPPRRGHRLSSSCAPRHSSRSHSNSDSMRSSVVIPMPAATAAVTRPSTTTITTTTTTPTPRRRGRAAQPSHISIPPFRRLARLAELRRPRHTRGPAQASSPRSTAGRWPAVCRALAAAAAAAATTTANLTTRAMALVRAATTTPTERLQLPPPSQWNTPRARHALRRHCLHHHRKTASHAAVAATAAAVWTRVKDRRRSSSSSGRTKKSSNSSTLLRWPRPPLSRRARVPLPPPLLCRRPSAGPSDAPQTRQWAPRAAPLASAPNTSRRSPLTPFCRLRRKRRGRASAPARLIRRSEAAQTAGCSSLRRRRRRRSRLRGPPPRRSRRAMRRSCRIRRASSQVTPFVSIATR